MHPVAAFGAMRSAGARRFAKPSATLNAGSHHHSAVAISQRIVGSVQPFLIDLLQQGLVDKTLARQRGYLQMLWARFLAVATMRPTLPGNLSTA